MPADPPGQTSSAVSAPLFTVALLGYDSAPYLAKALASVAEQRFPEFDVLCLVEESADDSLAICRKWADNRPDVQVVSLPKSGSGACSRNYAIDHAAGRYLVFVDGDDWLLPDMLSRLAARLRQVGDVDVLAFNAISTEFDDVRIGEGSRISNFAPGDDMGVHTGLDVIRRMGRRGSALQGFSWLNAYRTAFLRENRLLQPPGLLLEDSEWMTRVLFFARGVAFLDETLYVYRRRPGSLMTEASLRIVRHLALNLRSVIGFADSRDAPRDIVAVWANQWVSLLYWFLYHPVSSRKISDEDRRRALSTLFAGEGGRAFFRFARLASAPKRMGLPFLFLSSRGWHLPGKCFFRGVYYPLVARRSAAGAARPVRAGTSVPSAWRIRFLPVFIVLERLNFLFWKLAVWQFSALWPRRDFRPRALVVQPDHLGDMLVGLSPMQDVYDEWHSRGMKVDILVSPANAPLARACPLFDEVLAFDVLRPGFSVRDRWRLYRRLYAARYSAVVNLQYFPGSARRSHPLAVLCRARSCSTVMNVSMSPIRMTSWDRHFRVTRWRRRYSLFLEDGSPSVMLAARHLADCLVGRKMPLRLYSRGFSDLPDVAVPDSFYLVAPGALTRQPWPMERFAELMARIHGKWPDLVPVLTGGKREKRLGEELRRLLPPEIPVKDMIGETTTTELLSVIKKARFLVSNDAGTAHAAPLLSVPSVVVSGAWHPGVYQPNPLYGKTVCVIHHPDCAGCGWGKCPHAENGLDACLASISVDEVFGALERLFPDRPHQAAPVPATDCST